MADITPEEAIAHPNWDMGAKISVDSATMMNKALELIEARWLFDLRPEQLSAIIHPQSIVHGLVEYRDGSVLAQLAEPDMRGPIAWAIQTRPRLESGIPFLDLASRRRLEFMAVDETRFPAMRLVRGVLAGGDSLAIAFNAANEVANQAFRERRIAFMDIVRIVEAVLEASEDVSVAGLDDVWSRDLEARRLATSMIERVGAAR
jgi:1-deoxy-D-xylulose-5-phosphate reductoisomerase